MDCGSSEIRAMRFTANRIAFLSHFHSMCLFLFLDFLPQLLFDDRPLTVLAPSKTIRKHPGKLREQPEGRHADGGISRPAAVIALQQSRSIHISLFCGCRQLSLFCKKGRTGSRNSPWYICMGCGIFRRLSDCRRAAFS